MNPLEKLRTVGQSPWYDYIKRGLITSGQLQAMIDNDGLMGVTSNPSIFQKAITGSADYDEELERVAAQVTSVKDVYETLAIRDIQDATDVMVSVYKSSDGRDGYVSLEVSPDLAFNTKATIEEALRLWKAVNRPNVMIKVPGTPQGLPAVEQLLSQGVNINITLLFSVKVYEEVAKAYIRGLEKFLANGGDVSKIASVASFFVSRIDTVVDKQLDAKLKDETDGTKRLILESLKGKVAIANAKIAYLAYQEIFSSAPFQALRIKGAKVQRLLWASTGTKNPQYPDTYYMDTLIGPDTVNTIPAATFSAFRDHGTVRETLLEDQDEAKAMMRNLADCGLSIDDITETLLKDGARLFVESFDALMGSIARKRSELLGSKINCQTMSLGTYKSEVQETMKNLQSQDFVRRLWAKDASLWHSEPGHQKIIRNALGWLNISKQQVQHIPRLKSVAEEIKNAGFKYLLLLGVGGSSLCPEACRMTFGVVPGYPKLHVLDSTVPSQVKNFEERVDLERTLCIVVSKSGATTEPLVFQKYFFERMRQIKGERAGENFIAITDPGSFLEQVAKELKFRHIFPGALEIGGRYSALSNFGLVPAALMGVNIEHFIQRAERMRHSCDSTVPVAENPGIELGVVLGTLAKANRDKVTLITSPALSDLGAWLEQLIAESTGKEDKGIVPIHDEPLGEIVSYGDDRFFAYIRYTDGADLKQDDRVEALKEAGYPVIQIDVADLINLGQEFFRWEIATATAGSLMGINAFDQPNVQESKDYTISYLEEFKKSGQLPEEFPVVTDGDIRIFVDRANRQVFEGASTLEQIILAQLNRVRSGDYVAINAYVERTPSVHDSFQNIRTMVRNAKRVATTLGYGPRLLHSTGQLHKGGKNSGVFIQVTSDAAQDFAFTGESYSFGVLAAAQALGDMKSLNSRNRRVIRIHLGADVESGLSRLQAAVEGSLVAPKA